MIQRIQSIFLFLSSAGFLSLFFLPFAKSNKSFGSIYENQTLDLNDHIGLLSIAIVGGLIALLSIFLFNNRKLQLTMTTVAAITALPLLGLAYWLFSNNLPSDDSATTAYSLGFILPICSMIFALIAMTFIKKDDKLVKSMDRLR